MTDNINHHPGSILKGEFLTDEILDTRFQEIAQFHLDSIRATNSQTDLKKIKHVKLSILVESIELYRPRSKIREDKKGLIEYLKKFQKPIHTYSRKELLELRAQYVEPIISANRYGFKPKFGWLGGLIFILPLDLVILGIINLILWVSNAGFNLYVPFISIGFIISQAKSEIKAKKEGKLW